MHYISSLVVLLLLFSAPAFASKPKVDCESALRPKIKTTGNLVELFDRKGRQVDSYVKRIKKLRPGDLLDFGDGSRFIYDETLGHGRLAWVLAVYPENGRGPRMGLRLMYGLDSGADIADYGQGMEDYLEDLSELGHYGVPVPEVDPGRSRPPLYTVVEIKNVQFTLDEYFKREKADPRIDELLVEFAAKTFPYGRIGDFFPHQIAFTDEGFTLLDARSSGNQHGRVANFDSQFTAFDPVSVGDLFQGEEALQWALFPARLYGRMRTAILKARAAARASGNWFERREDIDSRADSYLFDTVAPVDASVGETLKISDRLDHTAIFTAGSKLKIEKRLDDAGPALVHYRVRMKKGQKADLFVVRVDRRPALKELANRTAGRKILQSGYDYVLVNTEN